MRWRLRGLFGLSLAAILIIFPLIAGEGYFLHLAIISLIFGILASGLDLTMGYAGLVSIAQGAFFGIGAYTSSIMMMHGYSFWISLPAAAVLTALIAMAVGIPSFRTRGIYYIIVTIGFQLIVSEVFDSWSEVTGGSIGLRGVPRPNAIILPMIATISFDSKTSYYYLTLALFFFAFLILRRLVNSPIGMALLAIRENESKASSLGLDPMRYKTLSFAVTCGLAGLAGSLYAHYLNYVNPALFDFFVSVDVFIMVMLGGPGTLFGPVAGSFILTGMQEVMYAAKALRLTLYGFLIVILILFMPSGLARPISILSSKLRSVTQRI